MPEQVKKNLGAENKKLNSQISIFAFAFIAVLVCELIFCKIPAGDDLIFSKALDNQSMKEFLTGRYKYWSSRVVIEAVMMTIEVYMPKAWYIINALVSAFAVTFSQLFFNKNKSLLIGCVSLAAFILLIPVSAYGGSGWINGTANYLWVWAAGLFTFYPIVMKIKGQKIKPVPYIISVILCVFSSNNEQFAALSLGVIICAFVYFAIFDKRFSKELLPHILIIIASMVFIFRSEGNAVRLVHETGLYMPEFEGFSVVDKLLNGYTNVIHGYMNIPGKQLTLLFLLVMLLFSLIALKKSFDKKALKHSWILPAIATLMLIVPAFIYGLYKIGRWHKGLRFLGLLWENQLYTGVADKVALFFQIMYGTVILGLAVVSLLIVARSNRERFVCGIMFMASVMTPAILGFSPTVIVSGERVFLFGNLIQIIIAFWCLDITLRQRKNYRKN